MAPVRNSIVYTAGIGIRLLIVLCKRNATIICCVALTLAFVAEAGSHAEDPNHQDESALPAHHDQHDDHEIDLEIGLIGNFLTELTDNRSNPNRGKFRAKEAEVALQAFILPGIRTNVVGALEQIYEHNHVVNEFHLEEAYLSFLDLPSDIDLTLGRKLIDFGVVNPVHPHRRPYADTPLVLANFLGEHNWYDDGFFANAPVASLWGTPIRAGFGYYRGRNESHGHEDEHDHEPIRWDGPVCLGRISALIGIDSASELDVGYSLASDSGRDTNLHGVDLTYVRRLAGKHQRIIWQNELLLADVKESDSESMGFYSMVNLSLDENWEIGGRYDWSQMPSDDRHHEWALSPFVTYHFNEWMSGRIQYRHRRMIDDRERENALFLQLVVELGSHSHVDH